MKKNIFILLIMWMCQLSALAQTDGYNPPNPPDPNLPETPTEKYVLTCKTSPSGAGSINRSSGTYAEGSSVYLYTSSNTGFIFQYWIDDEGNVLSPSSTLYYTMPKRNATVTAVYKYAPTNPGDPTPPTNTKTYTLTLKAKPVGAGSFSPNSTVSYQEGEQPRLYAYTNTGFRFKYWADAAGDTVSVAQTFYYRMPAKNTELYGVFEYVPTNPANPGSNAWDSFSGEVVVDDFVAGSMVNAIHNVIGGSSNSTNVTSIIAAGKMNSNDLSVVNYFSNCSILDLSRTTGLTTIPNYYFNSDNVLTQILLPATIESIESYSFRGCKSLVSLTCYATTPPTLSSTAFNGVPEGLVVYVPENSVEIYEAADVWKNYIIMPIQTNAYSLELNLPQDCSDGRYKNMAMELINVKSGQKYRYVVTDRLTYMFYNLQKGTTYNAYLKNLSGDVLSIIENIAVDDSDQSLTFDNIKQLRTAQLSVFTPDGADVTSQVDVRWFDAQSRFVCQGNAVDGQVEGAKVRYAVELPRLLGMQYANPTDSLYEVQAGSNNVLVTLKPLRTMTLSGKVLDDETGEPLEGATVTVSQTLNGKYSKAFTAKTDKQGVYTVEAFAAPTQITYAAAEFINQNVTLADSLLADASVALDDVRLVTINGTTISVDFTYTTSAAPGESPETQTLYADYNNVTYAIYNKTKQKQISGFSVQYPKLVMFEKSDEGDVLQITATSKSGAFKPVTVETTVNGSDKASATFPIVQLGGIRSTFTQTENPAVVALLYNAAGVLVKNLTYASSSVEFSDIADGEYTLVSMGESNLFSSVYKLEGLSEAGLKEGADYVKNKVAVESGVITVVKNVIVPFFDDSKLYYTGDNTAFTVNKSSIVAGNYLTMQAKLDFKEVYRPAVSNIELVFELPEGNSFVENSLMIGNKISQYEHADKTVVVALSDNYTDRVRFCVIPTNSGNYAPTAYVRFVMNGKTIVQPIGSAAYEVKDLEIKVPSFTANPILSVNGTAQARADIEVYDGSTLIGKTTSLANGFWKAECDLGEPYNMSMHNIYARVKTKQGLEFLTGSKECVYDAYRTEMKTVNMSFYNGWMRRNIELLWDFRTKTTSESSYSFYTGTDFTFVADLTNNDTTVVSGVTLNVFTSKGEKREVVTNYNEKLDRWVGVSHFDSDNLPVNLSATIYSANKVYMDRGFADVLANNYNEKKNNIVELRDTLNVLEQKTEDEFAAIDQKAAELSQMRTAFEAVSDAEERSVLLADYFKKQGLEAEPSDFIGDKDATVDQAFADAVNAKADYLINNPFNSDYDYEALDAKINEADNALSASVESIDYEKLLSASLSDTTTVVGSNGEKMTVSRVALDKLGTLTNVSDTIAIPMTDTTNIYVYVVNDKNIVVVDSLNQTAWTICNTPAAAEMAKLARAAKQNNFVQAMIEIKEKTSVLIASINAFASGIINDLSDQKDKLKLHSDGLKYERLKLQDESRYIGNHIKDLEKSIDNLRNTGNYMTLVEREDKIAKLKTEHTKLLNEMELCNKKINVLDAEIAKFAPKLLAAAKLAGQLKELQDVVNGLVTTIKYISYSIDDHGRWYSLINNILPCEGDSAKAAKLKADCEQDWTAIAWKKGYYPAFTITGLVTIANGYMMVKSPASLVLNVLIAIVGEYLNNTATTMFNNAQSYSYMTYPKRYRQYYELKCKNPSDIKKPRKPRPNPYPGDDEHKGSGDFDNVNPIHDPSGFVYESVESNRLQGVTASCYYKETVEDQYGDLSENIVLWNAEEYAQKNPLFTDENGMYAWDVPQGLWQVKFEKEGYQTTYSEWLPVPPPQMDVNIAMVQNVQPEVVNAKAYEDGVEIEFSKYMNIETLTNENIYLKLKTANSEELLKNITIELLNEEAASEGSTQKFASRIKLNPGEKDITLADEVYVVVSNKVQSYAGIQMAQAYSQKLDVEKKMRKIEVDATLNIGYGQQQTILVGVLPTDAAKGKTLYVKSASDMIATVACEGVVADENGRLPIVLDENGQATLTVSGELLGTTALNLSAKDAELTAQSVVNIVDPAKLAAVKDVVASRISGTAVYRGQTVALSCETEGATIYYTLDGSCPCDAAKRIKYTGKPIAINDNVTVKAMAVGLNGTESETKDFAYTIKQTNTRIALGDGWNWTSHNQATDIAADALKQENIKRVQTQTDEMYNDPVYGFVGYIDDVRAAQAVKVETKQATEFVLSGEQYNPTAEAIVLHMGWNWIGYPMDQVMSVAEAMEYLDAEEGDFLTNLAGGYAQYHDGNWVGDLEVMTPGQGYLYKSASDKSFVYNDKIVSKAKSMYGHKQSFYTAPWSVSARRYPNMMCVTAELYVDDTKQTADDYCIGAFVDGECRGIGKTVNGVVYLSIYGDKAQKVTFLAVDRTTGETLRLCEEVDFCADVLGSVAAPFALHLGESTGINGVAVDNPNSEGIYNVAGQKLQRLDKQGIYIIDGKKVSIK